MPPVPRSQLGPVQGADLGDCQGQLRHITSGGETCVAVTGMLTQQVSERQVGRGQDRQQPEPQRGRVVEQGQVPFRWMQHPCAQPQQARLHCPAHRDVDEQAALVRGGGITESEQRRRRSERP